jgi:hypothetical protein
MICKSCKNPIRKKDISCEWCGYYLIDEKDQLNNRPSSLSTKKSIRFVFDFKGSWALIFDYEVHILIDDIIVGKGSYRKGFSITYDYEIKKINPIITVKIKDSKKIQTIISLPSLDVEHIYEIQLTVSFLTGKFNQNPNVRKIDKVNSDF